MKIKQLLQIHQELTLDGKAPNALLELPESILYYFIGVLNDRQVQVPEQPEEKWPEEKWPEEKWKKKIG